MKVKVFNTVFKSPVIKHGYPVKICHASLRFNINKICNLEDFISSRLTSSKNTTKYLTLIIVTEVYELTFINYTSRF